nr:6K2 [Daphne virus Y]
GKDNVAKFAELEGRWNGSLMTKDILIVGSILVGGCWMIYESFTERMNEKVSYQ